MEFGERLYSISIYIIGIFNHFYLNVQLTFLGHLIELQQHIFFFLLNNAHTLTVSYCSIE